MNSPFLPLHPSILSRATVRAISELNTGLIVVARGGCAFRVGSTFRAVVNGQRHDSSCALSALSALRPVRLND